MQFLVVPRGGSQFVVFVVLIFGIFGFFGADFLLMRTEIPDLYHEGAAQSMQVHNAADNSTLPGSSGNPRCGKDLLTWPSLVIPSEGADGCCMSLILAMPQERTHTTKSQEERRRASQ